MAKMIPETPREFSPSSLEGVMFDSLSNLPDGYYVFHSFKIVSVKDGVIRESETDFVVFHPEKGLLCIEAKAGHVSYSDGQWYYGSGVEMRHGGPFEQARSNMRKLMRLFEDKGLRNELRHCKFLHSVWFPSVPKSGLNGINLPSDADRSIVLLKEDVFDPLQSIERIFDLSVPSRTETNLSPEQVKLVINRVLSPSFDLFISCTLDIDLGKHVFRRMIREQARIIDFLEDQPSAAINGTAGTGKTVLAIEKAQRSALLQERVLFLCYNRYLRDYLAATYKNDWIDFFTIDGLATALLGTSAHSPTALEEKLSELFIDDKFPYQHVVVDEGQDFGQDCYEDAGVLETLSEIVLSQPNGTFYVFYDKLQLVQSSSLPKCIDEAECRVTLRRNCRNTENIAITSTKPLGINKTPLMRDGLVKGEPPIIHIVNSASSYYSAVEAAYRDCAAKGYSDVMLLTCGTLDKSSLVGRIENGVVRIDNHDVPITTCRRFKGLEADAVILLDVDKESLTGKDKLLFYVGSSRARLKLCIIACLSDDECSEISAAFGRKSSRRPRKTLATALNTLLAM